MFCAHTNWAAVAQLATVRQPPEYFLVRSDSSTSTQSLFLQQHQPPLKRCFKRLQALNLPATHIIYCPQQQFQVTHTAVCASHIIKIYVHLDPQVSFNFFLQLIFLPHTFSLSLSLSSICVRLCAWVQHICILKRVIY